MKHWVCVERAQQVRALIDRHRPPREAPKESGAGRSARSRAGATTGARPRGERTRIDDGPALPCDDATSARDARSSVRDAPSRAPVASTPGVFGVLAARRAAQPLEPTCDGGRGPGRSAIPRGDERRIGRAKARAGRRSSMEVEAPEPSLHRSVVLKLARFVGRSTREAIPDRQSRGGTATTWSPDSPPPRVGREGALRRGEAATLVESTSMRRGRLDVRSPGRRTDAPSIVLPEPLCDRHNRSGRRRS